MGTAPDGKEQQRLAESPTKGWKRWGPYLSERAWGTVREDYSTDGSAWDYFPHDHARSRVYRWNEDGLAGICDERQRLCFALAVWNENDPILKERLFGLTNAQGNHGEDVKEYYFYLDSTPTHSYMQMLYKYPQRAFPYADLIEKNHNRSRSEPEYELIDTGIFAENRYFDIFVEYAKATPTDLLIRIRALNRGSEAASLHLLPTLWFRNTWSWGDSELRPQLRAHSAQQPNVHLILAEHPTLGEYLLAGEGASEFLFTENESNSQRLWDTPNPSAYVKDGINDAIVNRRVESINPNQVGTKAAVHYQMVIGASESRTIRLRLTENVSRETYTAAFDNFDALFSARQAEADEFYNALQPAALSADEKRVQRQALAGMLWSKQFYHYDVARWLQGDPGQPPPPAARKRGRNKDWTHLNAADIFSMPDAWEYPWFAAWDLAFQCIPLALVDPDFAKYQLLLLGREWYQHPSGALPAYEWEFGDVNPPVRAWAVWRVYQIDKEQRGHGDLQFLERAFHKLLLTFTWWVNRKDNEGMNVFQGGFLGLDNIGVFDRSKPLPTGGHIEQSDGTSWMGTFTLHMLLIALELAQENPAYQDIATKFFEHFLYIADALNNLGGKGLSLWDEQDEFFYDILHVGQDGTDAHIPLKVRSMVGLIPLFAVCVIEPKTLERLSDFKRHLDWFLKHRPDLANLISRWEVMGMQQRHLVALLRGHRMKRVLRRMLDPDEFLSAYGVRSLSRIHAEQPYIFETMGMRYEVKYLPAESDSGLFGGNSNWRGPIWFPVNYLIIESLHQFHAYYGDEFKVECPTGSGRYLTLGAIAEELAQRLIRIFLSDDVGQRPVFGKHSIFQNDMQWVDYIPFHEYFNGDDGRGLGASHQTGWTGLVAQLLQWQGEQRTITTQD